MDATSQFPPRFIQLSGNIYLFSNQIMLFWFEVYLRACLKYIHPEGMRTFPKEE